MTSRSVKDNGRQASTTKTRRVLIVDDAPTVRMYHRSILQAAGFETVEAGNGFEALELALVGKYDLMVVDVNMPQMDGFALVERLRSDEVGISWPIVMISTEAQDSDADSAYRVGANLFLIKPVEPDLLRRVADILTSPLPAAAAPLTGASFVESSSTRRIEGS